MHSSPVPLHLVALTPSCSRFGRRNWVCVAWTLFAFSLGAACAENTLALLLYSLMGQAPTLGGLQCSAAVGRKLVSGDSCWHMHSAYY